MMDKQPLTLQIETPTEKVPEQRKFLWYYAVLGAMAWGFSNFFYGLMDNRDFAANCLNYSGTLVIALLVKGYFLMKEKEGTIGRKMLNITTRHFYHEGVFRWVLVLRLAYRIFAYFICTYFIINTGYYAQLAHINFGILGCIFSLAAVSNTLIARFFFGEILSYRKYLGIAIILFGVGWISVLKG